MAAEFIFFSFRFLKLNNVFLFRAKCLILKHAYKCTYIHTRAPLCACFKTYYYMNGFCKIILLQKNISCLPFRGNTFCMLKRSHPGQSLVLALFLCDCSPRGMNKKILGDSRNQHLPPSSLHGGVKQPSGKVLVV